MRILTENLYSYRKLLFPDNQAKRVLIHMLFWGFFILYHLLFFIPAFSDRLKDSELIWVNVLYYGRYIPIFYLMQMSYRISKKVLKGAVLFLVLFLSAFLAEHMVTLSLYQYFQAAIGLEHLPGNFPVLGKLYLIPISLKNGKDWLVFTYDLLEMQLLILPIGIKMIKYGVSQDIEEIIRQKNQVQSELNTLRGQLAPHFTFNLLNSVHSEIRSVSKASANYIAQAAELIRFSLYEACQDFIPLDSELYYIEQYVELESLRTSQRAEINFTKKGSVNTHYQVPALMLITLVENAFKHSVHATTQRSCVEITSDVCEERLHFQVTNSIPIDKPPKSNVHKKQGGLGLMNLKRALQLYFPATHELIIEQSSTLFSIKLQVPLSRKLPS
nr:histidine kinase [uncultured Dyadobacter sp.]